MSRRNKRTSKAKAPAIAVTRDENDDPAVLQAQVELAGAPAPKLQPGSPAALLARAKDAVMSPFVSKKPPLPATRSVEGGADGPHLATIAEHGGGIHAQPPSPARQIGGERQEDAPLARQDAASQPALTGAAARSATPAKHAAPPPPQAPLLLSDEDEEEEDDFLLMHTPLPLWRVCGSRLAQCAAPMATLLPGRSSPGGGRSSPGGGRSSSGAGVVLAVLLVALAVAAIMAGLQGQRVIGAQRSGLAQQAAALPALQAQLQQVQRELSRAGDLAALQSQAQACAAHMEEVQGRQAAAAAQLRGLEAQVEGVAGHVARMQDAPALAPSGGAAAAPAAAGIDGPPNLASPACGTRVSAHSPLAAAGQPLALRLRAAMTRTLRPAAGGAGAAGTPPFLHPLADALVLSPRMQAAGHCLRLAAGPAAGTLAASRPVDALLAAAGGGSLVPGPVGGNTAFVEVQLPAMARISSVLAAGRTAAAQEQLVAGGAALPGAFEVVLYNASGAGGGLPRAGVWVGVMGGQGSGSAARLVLHEPVTADSVRVTALGLPQGAAAVCMPRLGVHGRAMDGVVVC